MQKLPKKLIMVATFFKCTSLCSSYIGGSIMASTWNILAWEEGVKEGFLSYNCLIGLLYMGLVMVWICEGYKDVTKWR